MFEVIWKALAASFESLTSLPLLLYWLVSVVLAAVIIWRRKDTTAMKEHWKKY